MNFSNDVLPLKSVAQVPGPAPLGGGRLKVVGWQSSRIFTVGSCSPISRAAPIRGSAAPIIRLEIAFIVIVLYPRESPPLLSIVRAYVRGIGVIRRKLTAVTPRVSRTKKMRSAPVEVTDNFSGS